MDQESLWHDTLESALGDVVNALGGPKTVGNVFWPTKTIEAAARQLNHSLDPERPEKLSAGEILWLLVEGRKVDCHVAMTFLSRAASYSDPTPIEPEDEYAALQRTFIESVRHQQKLVKRMEQLSAPRMEAVK